MGCYFSFGPRALITGKGREYVKAIPANRLLLETDYPENQGEVCSFEALHIALQSATTSIAAIKKTPETQEIIKETSRRLLSFGN
jgi:TatD DNase family protein